MYDHSAWADDASWDRLCSLNCDLTCIASSTRSEHFILFATSKFFVRPACFFSEGSPASSQKSGGWYHQPPPAISTRLLSTLFPATCTTRTQAPLHRSYPHTHSSTALTSIADSFCVVAFHGRFSVRRYRAPSVSQSEALSTSTPQHHQSSNRSSPHSRTAHQSSFGRRSALAPSCGPSDFQSPSSGSSRSHSFHW